MILYLDTSSLVKLYVAEEGSAAVRDLVGRAEAVATSDVSYVEARAAFARKHHQGGFTTEDYQQVVSDFEQDWGRYLALEVSPELLRMAGRLAEQKGLRALDAIHLASVLILRSRLASSLVFCSADSRLLAAADEQGLELADSF